MFRVSCIFLILIGIPSLAQSSFTHKGSGMRFTLPEGWTYTDQGNFFEASDPAQEVYLLFFEGKSQEAEASIEGALSDLGKLIKVPEITTEPTKSENNGLNITFLEGEGLTVNKEVIAWDLTCVQGTAKTMVIIAMGEIASNQKAVDGIYQSIHEQ